MQLLPPEDATRLAFVASISRLGRKSAAEIRENYVKFKTAQARRICTAIMRVMRISKPRLKSAPSNLKAARGLLAWANVKEPR